MKDFLFIYTAKASFVRQDLTYLQSRYSVTELPFCNAGSVRLLLSLLKQLVCLPVLLVKHRAVYIWFGDYHSFLPILLSGWFKRKTFLVVGGYDVVRNAELRYGSFKRPLRGACTLYSMRHAQVNLCVSGHILRKVRALAPKADSRLVFNGVPDRGYVPVPKKPEKVICVASLTTRQKLSIKGIDRLLDTARITPHFQYWLIGIFPDAYPETMATLPSNVHTIGFLPQEELLNHLADAQFYLQLSREESFCLAMAEAMLCDCIPIYTFTGGLPEVAGPHGVCIHPYSPLTVAQALENWSATGEKEKPSEWIRKHFLVEQRNLALGEIIDPILH